MAMTAKEKAEHYLRRGDFIEGDDMQVISQAVVDLEMMLTEAIKEVAGSCNFLCVYREAELCDHECEANVRAGLERKVKGD